MPLPNEALPRSSWTNRLITSKDHAAVQISVGEVDPTTGKLTGKTRTIAISGYVRAKGESDMAINTLMARFDAGEDEA